jgi:hypothetical protein
MFTSLQDTPACRLRDALQTGCFGCLFLIGSLLLWPIPAAFAQTQTETAEESTEQQAETDPAEVDQEEEEETEPVPLELDKPPSRFIPSEEISEDWSVTFPVDI